MNQSAEFASKLDEYARNRAELQNAPAESSPAKQRILVALDASPQSLAALGAAAALANLLRAEVCGIFVEDSDLERLCSLPFSAEIGAYSATARSLSRYCITREFHALEEGIRLTIQQVAQSVGVPWSLRVARGGVTSELLSAADEAMIISLGRVGWSRRNQMGSTAATVIRRTRRPLLLPGLPNNRTNPGKKSGQAEEIKVVYTGTAAADRALTLGHSLSMNSGHQLVVYYITDPLTDSAERNDALAHAQIISLRQRATSHILNIVQSSQPGITLLADVDAHLTASLIDTLADPLLLVS